MSFPGERSGRGGVARRSGRVRAGAALAVLLVAAGAGLVWLQREGPPGPEGPDATGFAAELDAWGLAREQWRGMFHAEERIHQLTPSLASLAFAVENLELPDARTRALFAPQVQVADLAPEPFGAAERFLPGLSARLRPGADPAPARRWAASELRLWRPLLDEVRYFHHASFAIVEGRFASSDPAEFEAEVAFSGLARMRTGELSALETRQTLRWRRTGPAAAGEGDWRIVEWRSRAGRRVDAPGSLFEEVLDRALMPEGLERARTSIHEGLVREYLLARRADLPFRKPHGAFRITAQDRHPGLAVVDWDRDGFDDVYVMARWGPNQFFRNRGDGSFEEIAAEIGLDVEGFSSSAVFADFDNDGDADLFLGRTLRRSAYLENTGARFENRSRGAVSGELPYLASSVSAVDVDSDGLLDVYVSTYAAAMLAPAVSEVAQKTAAGSFDPADPFPGLRFLPPADALEIVRRVQSPDYHPALAQPGPPNAWLRNRGGGRFERVRDGGALEVYRNTYQASWSDYDGDGDADVYLANDFAPDNLIRNDGGGRFTDVTHEMEGATLGLAMGATWGDYDRDGRPDLYVTNMFSKAGRRITAQLPSIDPRYREIAQGNILYRNTESGLVRVSGEGPGALAVERAGWGWGSLFADVDNDGFLDLFALSGFYTAPRAVELAVDT